ncbi:MAG: amidohydrolase family protein, partial [Phycisphaeraceae bacterium]
PPNRPTHRRQLPLTLRPPPPPLPAAKNAGKITQGRQPHAPYSAHPSLYAAVAREAAAQRTPICTHLAETLEEQELTAEGAGPFRDFLTQLGKWTPEVASFYGNGLHPVDWLDACSPLESARWLCAHCNYVDDAHIATLARRQWSVAYCPRASDYFGHRRHRYRDMLQAAVNVCLGTDSILCHGSLSILDEMRHLYQRDHTDPDLLLKMATVNGLQALGLNPDDGTFTPGATAGLIAVRYDHDGDPLEQILAADHPPEVRTLHPRADLQSPLSRLT